MVWCHHIDTFNMVYDEMFSFNTSALRPCAACATVRRAPHGALFLSKEQVKMCSAPEMTSLSLPLKFKDLFHSKISSKSSEVKLIICFPFQFVFFFFFYWSVLQNGRLGWAKPSYNFIFYILREKATCDRLTSWKSTFTIVLTLPSDVMHFSTTLVSRRQ